MTILAIEFSSEQRSVACARDGQILAEVCAAGGRSTQAMSLIESVLKQAGVARDDIDGFVIGLGPGSYTGIRTAIAVAQGWHLMKQSKVTGIGSVPCLAGRARHEQIFGHIDVVVDAQKQEVYHSAWQIDSTGMRETSALKIYPAAKLGEVLGAGGILVGPEATRWRADGKVVFPTARALCDLFFSCRNHFTSANLQPIYLREVSFIKAPPSRTY